MKNTTKKDTEIMHPVREHLGIDHKRWTEINGIVERTTRDSQTWGSVLIALSQNNELAGVEFILAGAIFSERQFRKIRQVLRYQQHLKGIELKSNPS